MLYPKLGLSARVPLHPHGDMPAATDVRHNSVWARMRITDVPLVLTRALAGMILIGNSACSSDGIAREIPAPLSVSASSGHVSLEESPSVITVEPAVSIDPRGGFIVADMVESQVRLYTRDGRLRSHFGGKGNGPSEFRGVTSALRLPSGEIAVFEMAGKIAIFDEDGRRLVRTQATPLVPIYDAAVLDSTHVLLAGRVNGRSDTPLVHVWDIEAGKPVASFFNVPEHPKEFARAYSFSGFADLAVRDSMIAVVFALRDTVYLFNRQGSERGKVPIPAPGFRRLAEPMPENSTHVQDQQWVQTFSTFANVFWTREGLLLAQYFDIRGVEPQWHLVGFDRSGLSRFDYPGAKLLAITPDDSLFFDDPNSMEPNQWSVASLSR